ncbi:MAG: AGE family epimerase/isomerase [Candidatus Marinimicrobia bacterium]|nr:AGE family epimerase/isomerase [Candidatus Neomarinimicrobiota bacterium]
MSMNNQMSRLKEGAEKVLFENILPFWIEKCFDKDNNRFYGAVDNFGNPIRDARISLILYTRILWAFSYLYKMYKEDKYQNLADTAYNYLVGNFIDREYGGAYWILDKYGRPNVEAKKIYGHAFLIYALSEYYEIKGNDKLLELINNFYSLIEEKFLDVADNGYFETFNRDWSKPAEMRISDRDMEAEKSMNSHLHMMEAYTNLYRVTRAKSVKSRLINILELLQRYIILPSGHLGLFFDSKWDLKSNNISFGHDIECSWLLTEAMGVLGSEVYENLRKISLKLAETTLNSAFNERNSIYREQRETGELEDDVEWWTQAEAVVGLINAYQLTGDNRYLEKALLAWDFIESFLVDWNYGEWFYEVSKDGKPNLKKLKVEEWKGPYHNVRACVNIILRVDKILREWRNPK